MAAEFPCRAEPFRSGFALENLVRLAGVAPDPSDPLPEYPPGGLTPLHVSYGVSYGVRRA
jgi:hypothetical protein